MYNYNPNEQNIGVDVDDTIVLWRKAEFGEQTVTVTCPYDGIPVVLVVHKPHVKLIKDRKARGCSIMVWSQSGPQWAKAVVDALGLQDVVDEVKGKPFMILDDLPPEVWLTNRVYLNPKSNYGSGNLELLDISKWDPA